MRVAYVTNIMTPYRIPLWDNMRDLVDDLHVVTLAMTEKNRKWVLPEALSFRHHNLQSPGIFIPRLDGALYWGGNMQRCLNAIAPTHVLMDGYAQLPFITAIQWAAARKLPVAQWYRGHAMSSHFTRGPMARLRKTLLRRANGWAVPGTLTQNYLTAMGIDESRIVQAPNAVETDIYGTPPLEPRTGPTRLLYVGQLIDRKGVDILLRAFLSLPPGLAQLRIVGAGPQEEALKSLAAGRADVDFAGPTRRSADTAAHYIWADVMAMPSHREVWGLVANEALAAGCYLLSSRYAAATIDLVDKAPIDAGLSIDPAAGPQDLHAILRRVIEAIDTIRARRDEIRAWGNRFTVRATAEGLVAALNIAAR